MGDTHNGKEMTHREDTGPDIPGSVCAKTASCDYSGHDRTETASVWWWTTCTSGRGGVGEGPRKRGETHTLIEDGPHWTAGWLLVEWMPNDEGLFPATSSSIRKRNASDWRPVDGLVTRRKIIHAISSYERALRPGSSRPSLSGLGGILQDLARS